MLFMFVIGGGLVVVVGFMFVDRLAGDSHKAILYYDLGWFSRQ